MVRTDINNAAILFEVLNRLLIKGLQVTTKVPSLYEAFRLKTWQVNSLCKHKPLERYSGLCYPKGTFHTDVIDLDSKKKGRINTLQQQQVILSMSILFLQLTTHREQ
jgi:hypothetical protein